MFRLMKLRPPNGWNAVTWELVIVVVGVLIALLAQQWVEERTWDAKVRHSKDALRGEIANHYAWSVEWRVVTPCLLGQIDQLRERVLRSRDRLDPAPLIRDPNLSYVFRMPSKEYLTSVWEAAQLDGISARFDDQARAELSAHYEQVRQLRGHTERNGVDWRRLLTLAQPIRLDPMVRYSLLQTLDELRGRVEFVDLLSGQLIDHIDKLGMTPPASFAQGALNRWNTVRFCHAHGLPLRSLTQAMTAVPN